MKMDQLQGIVVPVPIMERIEYVSIKHLPCLGNNSGNIKMFT